MTGRRLDAPIAHAARRARRLLAGAALVAAGIAGPVAAADDPWNLDQLMGRLAHERSGQATFVERKHLAILDEPVVSSGELRFRAPDRLEKLTLEPRRESLVLEGDTLTVTRGERRHVLRLADYPQVAAFIDSIRATLAGDRAALERTYALHLSGNAERWRLSLLPRDPKMAEVVLRIDIRGSHAMVAEIEILQADGDRSVMTVRPLAAGR
jgi:hypothetical protein